MKRCRGERPWDYEKWRRHREHDCAVLDSGTVGDMLMMLAILADDEHKFMLYSNRAIVLVSFSSAVFPS